MRYLSSAAQMRELDRRVIEDLGVPGVALMELASHAVAASIRAHHHPEASAGVAVVCGPGNNGGDGYGVARWLAGWGYPVHTVSLREASRGDAAQMRAACARMEIPDRAEPGPCGLIVDAVFGTGLGRAVRGPDRAAIEQMDQHPAPVVAVDLPSGIDADTGQPHGAWVRAVRTVTFGRLKPGLLIEPGAGCAGEVEVVDIGLEAGRQGDRLAVAEIPEAADLAPLWTRRAPSAHKGSSGHLLVVAGSAAMAGAAVLACRGALRSGAGLVTLLTPRGALPRLAALPPEVMVLTTPEERMTAAPKRDLSAFDAILAGPGLGGGQPLSKGVGEWLKHLWSLDDRPMIFDADALPMAQGNGGGPRVLTPHPGEAARLLRTAVTAVQRDRLKAALKLAGRRRVAVLKGPHTIVAGGGLPSLNPTGGPTLATAGAGDVLAGVIGALLARGIEARDAARLGVWVHGAAADRLAARRPGGWTAGDVAEALPEAVAELLSSAG